MTELPFEGKSWMWLFRMLGISQIMWVLLLTGEHGIVTLAMLVDMIVWIWMGAKFIEEYKVAIKEERKRVTWIVIGITLFLIFSAIWRRSVFLSDVLIEYAIEEGYSWFLIANIGVALTYYQLAEYSGMEKIAVNAKIEVRTLLQLAAIIDVCSATLIGIGQGMILTGAIVGKSIITPLLVSFSVFEIANKITRAEEKKRERLDQKKTSEKEGS